MKKVFLGLCVCAVFFASCGGSSNSGGSKDSSAAASQTAKAQEPNADTTANKTGSTNSGELAPGAKLIAANDCGTCHNADTKVIGPAFKDIAAKYPPTDANIETLTAKVIAGGKGNWGDVPMTPHPQVPKADVKEMVKYILSLKK